MRSTPITAAVFIQVIQVAALPFEFGQAQYFDTQMLMTTPKVNTGVLFLRFDFQQDHVFGFGIADDHFAQHFDVAVRIQAAEQMVVVRRNVEMLAVRFGEQVLEKIQRWKALHFNELRNVVALAHRGKCQNRVAGKWYGRPRRAPAGGRAKAASLRCLKSGCCNTAQMSSTPCKSWFFSDFGTKIGVSDTRKVGASPKAVFTVSRKPGIFRA